jgi:hypothetical protein
LVRRCLRPARWLGSRAGEDAGSAG